MRSDVFLGRQPIVDADRQVFGFELLYRGGPDRATAIDDPEAATRGVMERVLLQCMEHVVGDRFGLINAGADLVVRGLHRAMPPDRVLIEIRESEPFDEATVRALQQARYDGYHFVLDNVNRLGDLERSELLPLASIVKIELTTAHEAEIARLVSVARDRSPGVLVVAEKVESVIDFERCIEYGFDLFQGYYIARPEVLQRPARPAGTRSATALFAALCNDEPTIAAGRLEAIMSSDPSLAFRLLTAANANAYGLDRNLGSLDQAMGLLGPEKLRCIAELIAFSGDTIDDDVHIERGAVRARMAVALLADTDLAGSGVTVALLSTADSVYATPMAELLTELPVTEEICLALLHGQGRLGITLDIIRACERNDIAALEDLAPGRHGELVALLAAAVAATSADPVGTAHD